MIKKALGDNRRTRQVFNLCGCGGCGVCRLSLQRDKTYKNFKSKYKQTGQRKPNVDWMFGYDGPSSTIVSTALVTTQYAIYFNVAHALYGSLTECALTQR